MLTHTVYIIRQHVHFVNGHSEWEDIHTTTNVLEARESYKKSLIKGEANGMNLNDLALIEKNENVLREGRHEYKTKD